LDERSVFKSLMKRAALVLYGIAVVGFLSLAAGIGHLGPCADVPGATAAVTVMGGLFFGSVLLAGAGFRARAKKYPEKDSTDTAADTAD
jgi:hypothetical protein